jgi:hypothetical protein
MDPVLPRISVSFRDVETSTSGSATPGLSAPVDEFTVWPCGGVESAAE